MSARVTAQPTMASGAVKIGKSFTGSRQAVGVSGFAGKRKARAVSMGRRVAAHRDHAASSRGGARGSTPPRAPVCRSPPSAEPPLSSAFLGVPTNDHAPVVPPPAFFRAAGGFVRGRVKRERAMLLVRRPADAPHILRA